MAPAVNNLGSFLGISNLSQKAASALDGVSAGLDGAALAVDAGIVALETTAVCIGATAGAVSSPGTAPVTGPAGALLGFGMVHAATTPLLVLANGLATGATALTYESDLLTNESRFDVSLEANRDLSHASLTLSGKLGQDSYSSLALTGAGNVAPVAPLSLPIQTLSVANDLGLLRNPKVGEELIGLGNKFEKFDEGFGSIIKTVGIGSYLTSSYLSQKLPKSINYSIKNKLW